MERRLWCLFDRLKLSNGNQANKFAETSSHLYGYRYSTQAYENMNHSSSSCSKASISPTCSRRRVYSCLPYNLIRSKTGVSQPTR